MRSRLLAAATLLASAAVAWLTISLPWTARVLQGVIALSMVYVGYLAFRGWQVIRAAQRAARGTPPPPAQRPWITVMVPASNEAPVIAEMVTDLASQQYADASGARFDVLVVDDGSTDGTGDIARAAAEPFGASVQVIRREPNTGWATKAGALAYAEPHVRGDVVAVVDADSRVDPDFLARVMQAWETDADAAAIQAQRRVYNGETGWLARAQDEELVMDMASQCGRWATDGTAELRGSGMFLRRDVLDAIGGWDETAITEDLEVSTRLTAAGHHVALAPAAELCEEAVEEVVPLWRQRMRWAEGSMRRLIDHGPALLADSRLPLGRRADFLVFVTEFLVPPLFVTTIAGSLLTVAEPVPADWTIPVSLFLGYGLGTFLLAMGGLAAHGERGLRLLGRATRGALFLSLWLVVVPAALLKIAFLPRTLHFVQTPRKPRPAD